MPRLHIGKRSFENDLEKYARRYDFVEVRPDTSAPLRAATLKRWRNAVPSSFLFSVVLPSAATQLRPGREADDALEHALEVARLLEAPVIVIPTPISVTPTATHRKRIEELVTKLPHDVVCLAWEPSGVWEMHDAQALAAKIGVTLVADATRETLAPGPIAYTRLRGLGDARRASASRIEKALDSLSDRREAFVVVETEQPLRVARELRDGIAFETGIRPRTLRPRANVHPFSTEDEEQE